MKQVISAQACTSLRFRRLPTKLPPGHAKMEEGQLFAFVVQ
jgi:hypothetical protein